MGCAVRKLVIGSIEQNLVDLKALETPPMDDSVTRKIWTLLNRSCPMAPLVEGVSLLQHVGWSSSTVEQQHASATCVKRQHKKYGAQQLCTRAALHTARLFYSIDPVVKEEHKLQRQLQEQLDRTATRIPGSAMFIKRVFEIQGFRNRPSSAAATPSGLTVPQVRQTLCIAQRKWGGGSPLHRRKS